MANAIATFDIISDIDRASTAAFFRLSAPERASLLVGFESAINPFGGTDYDDFLTSQTMNRTIANGGGELPDSATVRLWFVDAVKAYNDMAEASGLATPPSISLGAGDPPTCVRYRWVNGVLIAIYNYELSFDGGGIAAPTDPIPNALRSVDILPKTGKLMLNMRAKFHMLMTYKTA